eukprot:TRINITY_DN3123_c0_g1_i2.p1 TRINITY_DN3123_c0_g1~~TRINITY_DN3123_c0_g1_i2.p1  ORF type:complete len:987 (+),score=292.92 TRINITY_DN3123_c0_g1_i2:2572-5532(+)
MSSKKKAKTSSGSGTSLNIDPLIPPKTTNYHANFLKSDVALPIYDLQQIHNIESAGKTEYTCPDTHKHLFDGEFVESLGSISEIVYVSAKDVLDYCGIENSEMKLFESSVDCSVDYLTDFVHRKTTRIPEIFPIVEYFGEFVSIFSCIFELWESIDKDCYLFELVKGYEKDWYCSDFKDELDILSLNGSGHYVVKLYVENKWRAVHIDDKLPLIKREKSEKDIDGNPIYVYEPVFPVTSSFEVWPALLIKACLHVLNGAPLNQEQILTWLTGRVFSSVSIHEALEKEMFPLFGIPSHDEFLAEIHTIKDQHQAKSELVDDYTIFEIRGRNMKYSGPCSFYDKDFWDVEKENDMGFVVYQKRSQMLNQKLPEFYIPTEVLLGTFENVCYMNKTQQLEVLDFSIEDSKGLFQSQLIILKNLCETPLLITLENKQYHNFDKQDCRNSIVRVHLLLPDGSQHLSTFVSDSLDVFVVDWPFEYALLKVEVYTTVGCSISFNVCEKTDLDLNLVKIRTFEDINQLCMYNLNNIHPAIFDFELNTQIQSAKGKRKSNSRQKKKKVKLESITTIPFDPFNTCPVDYSIRLETLYRDRINIVSSVNLNIATPDISENESSDNISNETPELLRVSGLTTIGCINKDVCELLIQDMKIALFDKAGFKVKECGVSEIEFFLKPDENYQVCVFVNSKIDFNESPSNIDITFLCQNVMTLTPLERIKEMNSNVTFPIGIDLERKLCSIILPEVSSIMCLHVALQKDQELIHLPLVLHRSQNDTYLPIHKHGSVEPFVFEENEIISFYLASCNHNLPALVTTEGKSEYTMNVFMQTFSTKGKSFKLSLDNTIFQELSSFMSKIPKRKEDKEDKEVQESNCGELDIYDIKSVKELAKEAELTHEMIIGLDETNPEEFFKKDDDDLSQKYLEMVNNFEVLLDTTDEFSIQQLNSSTEYAVEFSTILNNFNEKREELLEDAKRQWSARYQPQADKGKKKKGKKR